MGYLDHSVVCVSFLWMNWAKWWSTDESSVELLKWVTHLGVDTGQSGRSYGTNVSQFRRSIVGGVVIYREIRFLDRGKE